MALAERVRIARSMVRAGMVKQLGPRRWRVRGRTGDYVVYRPAGTLALECHRMTKVGDVPCPAMSNGHICVHVIESIIAGAKRKRHKVSFCESKTQAERLSRLGGDVVHVRSRQGSGEVFVVVR